MCRYLWLKAQQVGAYVYNLSPRLNRNSLRHLLRAAALTAASIGFEASSMDAVLKAQQVGVCLQPIAKA
ncbi:hypothetical protein [Legionella impletisoli]|uniref:Uncharacterized protein n=1 Tax=Legionella impletisoli TaxID=343510 RepID=A0A917NE86_9GAMM|nr:hypothetical protein [Legionella impletisoli]GGI89300.1 hypothetical protein GCM10007966_17530 [Legionella impletisoli]